MNNYRLTSTAKEDLYRIWFYGLHKFGRVQADRYYDNLVNHFQAIGRTPLQFPASEEVKESCRKCVCGSDTIYFRIQSDHVEITAIIGSQDAAAWME
ncbi:MAG: type II toxin-antitoxin system RelE/ParE family toxin [Flavobacteriales bacterium]